MKTVILPNGVYTAIADLANTIYKVENGTNIATENYAIDASGMAAGRKLAIDGNLFGAEEALLIGTSSVSPPAVMVTIGKHGELNGNNGILSYGDGHVIRNAGTIHGNNSGVEFHGEQTIVNSGTISGFNAVNVFTGTGDLTTIRNSGTIDGGTNGKAIYGSSGNETVVNTGTIHGDIALASGNDTFVFKSGKVDGTVFGGLGGDTYVVHKAGLDIVEYSGEGLEMVHSSVTFELQVNVENIILTGKKDVDAIGNGASNWMQGNSGNNLLYGWYGDDTLDGKAGKDILTGGAGADIFVFERGTGKDTITDYDWGADEIRLGELNGVKDYADMLAHHVDEKANGDLWITYGHDTVVLKDTALANLLSGDFLYEAT